ncbi:hypothetical protein KJ766_00180, partial [Patescibacteria group bacterium]|nr:hypothetical protein [Patescibacteria group bacterium]
HKEIALKIIESGGAFDLAHNLEKFIGILPEDHKDIVFEMMKKGSSKSFIDNIDKFTGITPEDHKEIALKIIESGYAEGVVDNIDKFTGIKADDIQEIVLIIIERKNSALIAENLKKFGILNNQICEMLIEEGYISQIFKSLETFPNNKILQVVLDLFGMYTTGNLYFFVKTFLNDSGGQIKPDIEMRQGQNLLQRLTAGTLNKVFGFLGMKKVANLFNFQESDIKETPVTEQERFLQWLKVEQRGFGGIEDLRKAIRKTRLDIFSGNIEAEVFIDQPLLKEMYQSVVRYKVSGFGGHSDSQFEVMLKEFQGAENSIRPLPEEYEPSEVLLVDRVDTAANADFVYSEGFLSKFVQVVETLKEAQRFHREKQMLIPVLDAIKTKKAALLQKYKTQLVETDNEKARKNIEVRIEALEQLDLDHISTSELREVFTALSSFKGEFNDELRSALFWFSFQLNPTFLEKDLDAIDLLHPTVDDVSWVINFVDHITNKETLGKYFKNKTQAKAFKGFVNVNAFTDELSRMQNRDVVGSTSFQFVPQRNLLTEFSGHISDACWANKYSSILREFPNFISVTMVINPEDDRFARLAGACFLIETDSTDGEPLLVIRGLNPQENVINSLSVEDFYKKFTQYAQELAQRTGRKLAIVIDDHSGGSSTNRPVLYNYLDEKKSELKKIIIPNDKMTNFNNYNISGDCYLVS